MFEGAEIILLDLEERGARRTWFKARINGDDVDYVICAEFDDETVWEIGEAEVLAAPPRQPATKKRKAATVECSVCGKRVPRKGTQLHEGKVVCGDACRRRARTRRSDEEEVPESNEEGD